MFYHRKLVVVALLAVSHTAFSSAFMLHEQNASGLGEFYAGAGAIAEDASTNFYNPAGLVLLPGTQISISGVNVTSSFEFEGTTQYKSPTTALYTATGDASAGTARLVPALHISHRFNKEWAAGFSATAPFGLATAYDSESLVRYQTINSELKTMNLGPSVAYRVLPWLSFGAGFDAQYAEITTSAATNYTLGVMPSPSTDSISTNKADSWAWGWHAGALAIISPQSNVGLNFRSNIEHDFSGNSRYKYANGQFLTDSHVTGTADLPWLIDLSGVHKFNDKWTVLGSISYTNWSSITELKLENVAVMVPTPGGTPTTGTSVDSLNYENSWSAFAGLRYQFNPTVMVKVGGGYDQTPTQDKDRDLIVPDSDRWIASAGIRLVPPMASRVSLDVAYAHIFADEASVNKNLSDPSKGIVNTADGDVTAHADLIGAQISLKI